MRGNTARRLPRVVEDAIDLHGLGESWAVISDRLGLPLSTLARRLYESGQRQLGAEVARECRHDLRLRSLTPDPAGWR